MTLSETAKYVTEVSTATTPSKRPPMRRRHPLRPTSFQMFYVGHIRFTYIDRIIEQYACWVINEIQYPIIGQYAVHIYSNRGSYVVKHIHVSKKMCRKIPCMLSNDTHILWFSTVAVM